MAAVVGVKPLRQQTIAAYMIARHRRAYIRSCLLWCPIPILIVLVIFAAIRTPWVLSIVILAAVAGGLIGAFYDDWRNCRKMEQLRRKADALAMTLGTDVPISSLRTENTLGCFVTLISIRCLRLLESTSLKIVGYPLPARIFARKWHRLVADRRRRHWLPSGRRAPG